MLTRLYIDNFRCFEKFEWRPGRKQLILGRNGTGKTSLMDAVECLVEVAARGERVDKWFKLHQRNRWLFQPEQVFEIEAELDGLKYEYRLVTKPAGDPPGLAVHSESVRLNDEVILEFSNGEVAGHPNNALISSPYRLDPSRSALATAGAPELAAFRDWLSGISYWHINPFGMGSFAKSEDIDPRGGFPSWYRHLVRAHPDENGPFLQSLRESLDGFEQLSLQPPTEQLRILYVEFHRDGHRVGIPFAEISDGQRCLICLYAIMHFIVARGGTVFIDEPDNFISLREIQPWLMTLEEIADDNKGQVILISHHPEILNQWAGPYGVQFVRDGAGLVKVQKFKGDPESSLTVAELVARGWDLE